jgi:hypothetical protein
MFLIRIEESYTEGHREGTEFHGGKPELGFLGFMNFRIFSFSRRENIFVEIC